MRRFIRADNWVLWLAVTISVPVSLLIIATILMELDDDYVVVTDLPAPTPTPSSTGLGVSRAEIQVVFASSDIGFEFDPVTTLASGEPNLVGYAPGETAILELTGPRDNLTSVALLMDMGDQSFVAFNGVYALGLIVQVLPDWDDRLEWFSEGLERILDGDEAVRTRHKNVAVELSYLETLGLLILKIEAK